MTDYNHIESYLDSNYNVQNRLSYQ